MYYLLVRFQLTVVSIGFIFFLAHSSHAPSFLPAFFPSPFLPSLRPFLRLVVVVQVLREEINRVVPMFSSIFHSLLIITT